MVINTLNESHLHKKLKEIYSLEEDSRTEVMMDGVVYDILLPDNSIIEIQTKNLSKLLSKASQALSRGQSFTIVHPVPQEKIIETYTPEGELISRRKSPKKIGIYGVFRELTGLYPVLLEKNFTLKLLFCTITEIRTFSEEKCQSQNGRRHFKKNWLKSGKRLEKINEEITLKTKEDYLALIPSTLNKEFTKKELSEELKKSVGIKKACANDASLFCWVLQKMDLLEYMGKKGRAGLFRIKENN